MAVFGGVTPLVPLVVDEPSSCLMTPVISPSLLTLKALFVPAEMAPETSRLARLEALLLLTFKVEVPAVATSIVKAELERCRVVAPVVIMPPEPVLSTNLPEPFGAKVKSPLDEVLIMPLAPPNVKAVLVSVSLLIVLLKIAAPATVVVTPLLAIVIALAVPVPTLRVPALIVSMAGVRTEVPK